MLAQRFRINRAGVRVLKGLQPKLRTHSIEHTLVVCIGVAARLIEGHPDPLRDPGDAQRQWTRLPGDAVQNNGHTEDEKPCRS